MAPAPTPPPGSMTVPPLFGWEFILAGLLVLVAVAVAFLVVGSARASRSERAEWQAWLDARSARPPAADDRPAELVRPEQRLGG
jgi:hypothetical protein